MSPPPDPTLRLRVDAQALADNWRALDALSGAASAGAAIKADCYGLGTDRCLPAIRDAGCEQFFVAHWSEVAAAARHVDPAQIAVLHGPMRDDEVAYAREAGAVPVINSLAQARRWSEGGGGTCHLMIDTGINRLGVAPGELTDPAIRALDIDILMSHLACADEDSAMNARQLSRFADCRSAVSHRRASLANSAGISLGEDFAFDLTRPGLSIYGGIPREELASEIRAVAGIEAAVIQMRSISAGESVGYNAAFTATRDMRIATVSLGYADGFLRARGPGTSLAHRGRALPLLGKVSMDMVVVDCVAAPDLREGDWLSVPFDLGEAARSSGLSQYELLTVLGSRLKT
ncbi:alanine racemase [Qipengyuania nanhaisediminis]|uniref:alanine racemase n=1 Tax=Qipengyuania nanhaisediminis TaxID=604088 RepID=UPI0038B29151